MTLISPNLTILIFVGIIILSLILAWWMDTYKSYEKSRCHIFMGILSTLSVFIIFIFYYNVVELQYQQQKSINIQEVGRINESILNSVLEEINNSNSIIPNFISSISPLSFTDYNGENEIDVENNKTRTQKYILSYRIFSLWQDVILSKNILDYDPDAYICEFLQQANSEQLYEQWKKIKINFVKNARIFGDILFEFGLKIKTQTPEEYSLKAKEIMKDPRYKDILSKR